MVNNLYCFFGRILSHSRTLETSRTPHEKNKGIFELFPPRFHYRRTPIQAAGRLDVDTTGLILFSDDGHFINHFQGSKLTKEYIVTLKHPISEEFINKLKNGVLLHDENEPISPLDVTKIDDITIKMILNEGKYHQVKRMVAAASNRVIGLRRTAIGTLRLDELQLEEGEWKYLDYKTLRHKLLYKV